MGRSDIEARDVLIAGSDEEYDTSVLFEDPNLEFDSEGNPLTLIFEGKSYEVKKDELGMYIEFGGGVQSMLKDLDGSWYLEHEGKKYQVFSEDGLLGVY